MSETSMITYSTKARAHELALLNLKSQDLSQLSPKSLADKYLDVYNEIFNTLNDARLNKTK